MKSESTGKIRPGKSPRTIRKNLKELRKQCIETSPRDPILSRIAYAMETAVRWAILDTAGWESLANEAQENAKVLRKELERQTKC